MEREGIEREGIEREGIGRERVEREECVETEKERSLYDTPIFRYDDEEVKGERREFCENRAHFERFLDIKTVSDGVIALRLTKTVPANPDEGYVPMYIYDIRIEGGDEIAGEISLRIGYNENIYYGGNIGYAVEEKHRGNGYAGRACKLIFELARAHRMPVLSISNEYRNRKSMRVCEKIGMTFVRTVELPPDNEMRSRGHLYENLYRIEL